MEEFDGHTVEYEVDGVPVKEKEFTATVIGFCGGDTEKPKMLTMPDYFPEQLSWDTQRKILLEICGDISDDEIIAANDDLKELKDFLRMNGTAEAEQLLPEGDTVHTFYNNGPMLTGADWSRSEIIDKVCYYNLLTSGKLNSYLADIEQQAQQLFLRQVKDLAEKENITEKLKSENQMLWVQKMNNIRNQATEIVNTEIIYTV